MKEYTAPDLRNFAVLGHASAGKTMLCEAMLACAGRIGRLGSIAAGTTVSDYHASEHAHQISVHASLLHLEWMERKFNVLDCPGYADFISEGLGALRVGDFALVVINAAHGLGVGTDAVWDYATHHGLPKISFFTLRCGSRLMGNGASGRVCHRRRGFVRGSSRSGGSRARRL